MHYFGMSYEEVLQSPFQRLLMLTASIPKYESEKIEEPKKMSLFDFAQTTNIPIHKA